MVEGTWNVGVAGGGLTVVVPRVPTPLGGVQVIVSVVGMSFDHVGDRGV